MIMHLILQSGHGSSIFIRIGVDVGGGVKNTDSKYNNSKDNNNVLYIAFKIIGNNYSNLLCHFL